MQDTYHKTRTFGWYGGYHPKAEPPWSFYSDCYIDQHLAEQAERERVGFYACQNHRPVNLSQVRAIVDRFDRLIADMRAAVEAERRKM